MRAFAVLLVLFVVAARSDSASAGEGFQWILAEDYDYLEVHDPGYLVLEDSNGTKSELEFRYEGLSHEVVSAWPAGKKIRVAYSPEQGTEIVDLANNERYSVRGTIRIQELQKRCEASGALPQMMAVRVCQAEAAAKWDLELNRAYETIMKGPLSEATKAAVRSSQRKWLEYRDSSIAALSAWGAEVGGTATQLSIGASIGGLTSSQTHRLRLLAYP